MKEKVAVKTDRMTGSMSGESHNVRRVAISRKQDKRRYAFTSKEGRRERTCSICDRGRRARLAANERQAEAKAERWPP